MLKIVLIIVCILNALGISAMYFITGNGVYFDFTGNWFPYLEIRPYYQSVIFSCISIGFLLLIYLINKRNLKRYAKILFICMFTFFSLFFSYLSGQFVAVYADGNLREQFLIFTIRKGQIRSFSEKKNKCFDFANFHDSVWWGHWPCAMQSECLFNQTIDKNKEDIFLRAYLLDIDKTFIVFKGFGNCFSLTHEKNVFKNLNSLNN